MTDQTALYRIIAPTYLAGSLYSAENQPADGVPWDGPPNAAMVPLNAAAERRVAALTEKAKRPATQSAGDKADNVVAALTARAETAEARVSELIVERDALADQLAAMAKSAPAVEPIDDLADARTTPGDSSEKLEAIEREVDEANGKLTPAQNAALDHDGDDKAGGSTPKAGRSPEEEAERAALFKFFKELDVKVFAGSTTEKLRAKKAELEAATAP